jgi:signal transduction histidine kinase
MNTTIQPGLLRVFRYFVFVALGYYAVVTAFAIIMGGHGNYSSLMQFLINLALNIGLSIYLAWSWLQRRLKRWYLPIALLTATVVPIFSNLFYLAEPVEKDLSLVIVRSWLLFPILIVPLVLIAWQYSFRYVLAFTVITAAVELTVLYPVVGKFDLETLPILGLPLIRAFAFGTVGEIVTHLISTQEAQSKALLKANYRLARHAETLEQLAVSRERNRLARELHDTLAHTLSGQAVNLEALKLSVPAEQTETLQMLDRALEQTRAGLRETRRALKALRSQPLEDLGLAMAVRNLAQDAASRAGFELALDIAEQLPSLAPDAAQCIFRIAQESLENIVRHAGAGQVWLSLGVTGRRMQLVIRDNGIGADMEHIALPDQLGLQGMQERAAEVQGALAVHSQPGQGTTIQFSVEVPDDQSVDL